MRHTTGVVPAFGYNFILMHHNAAHHGVGGGMSCTPLRQFQAALHHLFVEGHGAKLLAIFAHWPGCSIKNPKQPDYRGCFWSFTANYQPAGPCWLSVRVYH
jgi:hypothetical protein